MPAGEPAQVARMVCSPALLFSILKRYDRMSRIGCYDTLQSSQQPDHSEPPDRQRAPTGTGGGMASGGTESGSGSQPGGGVWLEGRPIRSMPDLEPCHGAWSSGSFDPLIPVDIGTRS